MHHLFRKWPLGLAVLLLTAAALLAGCARPTPTPTPVPPPPTTAPPPEEKPLSPAEAATCPYLEVWAASGHADATSLSFTYWNEADPREIPVQCAKCHSTPGFLDFLGADGSEAGKVDKAAPVGTVIFCEACHNPAAEQLASVVFPSGAEVKGLGDEARCMQCHQGRASTVAVDEAVTKAGVGDDQVSADLAFINIHYYAAAAVRYGTLAKGGYQYPGKSYDARFGHVEGFVTCLDCHNPHALKVKVEACTTCHPDVKTVEDFKKVRTLGSTKDYDGDGDVKEGIYGEIETLQAMLFGAIQAYAKEVSKVAIAYSPVAYPYFFVDTNGNGQADQEEVNYQNRYNAWTPRLLKAAYNYQTSLKDPGAYVHGGKYIIQLLYDSIEDLNQAISQPVDLSKAHRVDAGHFDGSARAWRNWDAQGEVPAACVKCHTAEGLPMFLKNNATIAVAPSDSMACTTCHDHANWPARYEVKEVTFPSGAKVALSLDDNLCLLCHQGRQSKVAVDRATAGMAPDTPSDQLAFLNVHYAPSGATLFGTEVKGAYEYDGKTYVGRYMHVQGFQTCLDCHDAHGLEVDVKTCAGCHKVEKPEDIRIDATDYDGDGDTKEGIAGEVETVREALYAAIQKYAVEKAGKPIVFHPHIFPYFFVDTNGNGQPDPDETTAQNRYNAWTPRLLKAAYNYNFAHKDPAAYVHNGKYVLQVLYDSLADIGGSVKGMTRP
ncbi:MAG: hypothetical protein N3B68_09040 [Anaerolineae bacterium]|nr:hypothetical protein [Anaerolineae bacterium]